VTAAELDAAARQEIAELQVRYATGIDRRDWDLFRTCFTDDCVADYGDIGVWHGTDEITAWMDQAHQGAGHTLHRITNHAVAVDGDWYGTLDAIVDGRLDPLPSVGEDIGLDEVPEALERTRRSEGPPRIIVHPHR
jgi:hypothetical protein